MLAFVLLLIAILVVSVSLPRLNPGMLALTATLILAPQALHMSASEAISALFPTHLFLTLVGVTFFFTSLNSCGLLDALLLRIVARFGKFPRAIPVVLFTVVALFTALGMGNIASVALIAPIAIRLADVLKFSKILMSILVVGAANAASLSPLTLPGILVDTFIHKSPELSAKISPDLLKWTIFISVFVVISIVTAAGFFLLGGFTWWKTHKRTNLLNLNTDLPQANGELSEQQRKAARISIGLLTLFLISCLLLMPFASASLPTSLLWIPKRFSEIGTLGWLGVLLLFLFKASDFEEAIQKIPWSTIFLVSGMSTYIELFNRLGLATELVTTLKQNIPIVWLTPIVSSAAALVSSFTSSVGVALPLFLPLVENLSPGLDTSVVSALLISVSLGSHLVDASPLSTLGALCMAQVTKLTERNNLYRALLLWGFAMIPVSGVVGWFVYAILKR
jgi:di/tricarboxylate transporter